jgi:hypothetical protein
MATKLIYKAELRDMFTGNMMKYEVEILLNEVKIEGVYIIDPDGARARCSIVEQAVKK